MLLVEVLDVRYNRTIVESATHETTSSLKDGFDYSFVVAMKEFSDDSYVVVGKKSCLIDLSKDIDSIINAFSSTSRNEYRRSEKISGLEFHSSVTDFDNYYKFYTACEKDRNWFPVPPEELKASIVFSATYEGQPISGMSCYGHGQRLRVGRIYSNKRSRKNEILNNTLYGSAAKRIVVEICKYGMLHGYKSLDLGGVDLTLGEKSGITQFKLSLGGEVVDVKIGRYMSEMFQNKKQVFSSNGWDLT